MPQSATVLHPTLRSFERDVIHAKLPVLVDFGAAWCPPCLTLRPELEAAARALAGQARVASISVDEERELAEAYGAVTLPALLLFKGGDVVDAWVGFTPTARIVERVRSHLDGA